jgi:4-amino-4-deoxy-L-arabinose transferase-like glycosyltransferase
MRPIDSNVLTKNKLILMGTAILLLAAWLRLNDIGADPFMADQERISVLASDFARDGDWQILGTRMSVGSLKHSPLTIYLYALPYSLADNPRIARIFTGLVNLVAVALVQLVGRRYFSPITGLLAAFFLAINPMTVHHSRFIWNPNLAPPFVMLFLLTILQGFYREKSSARLSHLPMLCLAGQCHPTMFLLAPMAFIGWIHAWRHSKSNRRDIVIHTLLSGLIALVLMVPWIIGLYKHISTLEYLRQIPHRDTPGWQEVIHMIHSALSGSFDTFAQDIPSMPALSILTIVAALWLTIRGLARKEGLPGLLAVTGFFSVPIVVIALSTPLITSITETLFFAKGVELNWVISMTMGNAALIQAAFIGGVIIRQSDNSRLSWFWKWRSLLHTKQLVVPTILALLGTTVIIMQSHLEYDYRADTGLKSLYAGQNTLDDSADALRYAKELASTNNQELILLASDPPLQTLQCVGCRHWEALMLTKSNSTRVIWDGDGVPLPANGALLLAPFNYSTRPLLFSDNDTIFTWFAIANLPSSDQFRPDLPLAQPAHFSNGVTVLGFLREVPNSMPSSEKPWTIHMLWWTDMSNSAKNKLSVQLIDSNGTKYGQVDQPGITANQQQPGEHILSQLDFQISQDMPDSGPLYLRFNMYNDVGQSEIVDATIANPNMLQFRRSAVPLASMPNDLDLDSFSMDSTLTQGQPLNVTANWKTLHEYPNLDSLKIKWKLETDDDTVMFDQITNLLTQSSLTTLPSNTFVKEQYTLRIPTDLLRGKYRLTLHVSDLSNSTSLLTYSDYLTITPRKRAFAVPKMLHPVNAIFGATIELAGYDINYDDSSLHLTLHWQALGQIDSDYKYFVHLWDNDKLVAQIDTMPDSYQYPTSWWAPNEVYSDTVEIDISHLKSGQYNLSAGVYDFATNNRLSISEGMNSDTSSDIIKLLPVVLELR